MAPEVVVAVVGVTGMLIRALIDLRVIRRELHHLVLVQRVEVERVNDLSIRVRSLEEKVA